ncbi:pentapeptide repeat-containing protein [Nonomuraea turcica]|uniref:pentapeptide repeat-containing protein n=1 Tax=Nonomuraea sp. G32 TaxID=3067274 RepID=UPI00273C1658|nr:pentapeptide repeat-containing protein [Nonomuraea sp. G32]MDP4506911.1 pentapeptide repeat-containing protein [Nonomuraea sp. G32]
MANRRPTFPIEKTIGAADWGDPLELTGESYRRVLFQDVDLTELLNRGCSFEECTFGNVRFNVSEHDDAQFLNCTFIGCSFFDATFRGCKLTGSVFEGCTYGLLKVEGGDWSYVVMSGADLRGSSIDGARLREADLSGVQLEGAELRRADLSGAWLRGADLTKCDLRGSDLSTLDLEQVTFKDAIIDPFQATVVATALGLIVRE